MPDIITYTLDSTLSDYKTSINVSFENGKLKTELGPYEIMQLLRRLPLRLHYHDHELTATTHFFITLVECVKYAQQKKWELDEKIEKSNAQRQLDIEDHTIHATINADTEALNQWKKHMAFYTDLFPILDALANLEALINQPGKTIADLQNTLDGYQTKIEAIFAALKHETIIPTDAKHKTTYETNLTDFQQALLGESIDLYTKTTNYAFTEYKSITDFKQHITDNSDEKNITAFLSNHTMTHGIQPLGLFVVHQVQRITSAVAQYRKIFESSPGHEDYLEKSWDLQQLDVLNDVILAFSKSLAAIRFSPSKPIPNDTIEILRIAGGNTDNCNDSIVTLNDFLKDSEQTDINAVEKLLCHISGDKSKIVGYQSYQQALWTISAISVAILIETAATIAIRFSISIAVGLVAGIFKMLLAILNTIGLISKPSLKANKSAITHTLATLDKWLDDKQNACSSTGANVLGLEIGGLAYLRKTRDSIPLALNTQTAEEEDDKKKLLKAIAEYPKSSLAAKAGKSLSSTYIDKGVVNGYKSLYAFFHDTLIQFSYLGASRRTKDYKESQYSDLLKQLILQLEVKMQTPELSALLENDVEIGEQDLSPIITYLRKLADDTTAPTTLAINVDENKVCEKTPAFIQIKPNIVGASQSVMDFPEELALGFAKLINGVFIKLFSAATAAEALAFVALYYAYKNEGVFFPTVLNELSEGFTGEGTVSDVRLLMADFLFWKLATLAMEIVPKLHKFDPHFFEKLWGDPERLLLGGTTFVAGGIALQLLPLIPETINLFYQNSLLNKVFSWWPESLQTFIDSTLSHYPAMANIFIIEARIAWGAQIPFNFLEYFFLGLKATFLLGNIASGRHKPHFERNEAKLLQILNELKTLSSDDSNPIPKNQTQATQYIVRLFDALGLPIKRQQAQLLFDRLSIANEHAEFKESSSSFIKYFQTDPSATEPKCTTDPELLNDLYNQNIYKGCNNLLQIISLFPFVFFTYPYRATMYLAARYYQIPHIQHGIIKDFSEEATMLMQLPTAVLYQPFRTFVLGLNQLLKASLALTCGAASYMGADFPYWNKHLIKKIELHNDMSKIGTLPVSALIAFFKMLNVVLHCNKEAWKQNPPHLYAKWSHMANTNQLEKPHKKLASGPNKEETLSRQNSSTQSTCCDSLGSCNCMIIVDTNGSNNTAPNNASCCDPTRYCPPIDRNCTDLNCTTLSTCSSTLFNNTTNIVCSCGQSSCECITSTVGNAISMTGPCVDGVANGVVGGISTVSGCVCGSLQCAGQCIVPCVEITCGIIGSCLS